MSGLGIYIHWPFCLKKCPYCDFNSHVRRDYGNWADNIIRELKFWRPRLAANKIIKSIFFGGGTPSLAEPQDIAKILNNIGKDWNLADPEITLEANPNSSEQKRFEDFKAAGVNRISIGVQSFCDEELKFLGRTHNSDEAKKAVENAQKIFANYSFDLIYALPQQNLANWAQTLEQALELARDHVSLYQLTIEPGTKFAVEVNSKKWQPMADDLAAEFYEVTESVSQTKGFSAYEISNYSRNKPCLHNLGYWRYQDFLGLGPGAHSRINWQGQQWALINHKNPETWTKKISETDQGTEFSQTLTPAEILQEKILMGLRINEGFPKHNFKLERIAFLEDLKLLKSDDEKIYLTLTGRLKLNRIVKELIC